MTVRREVRRFVELGPLRPEDDESDDADAALEAQERALLAIQRPVTDDEAELLIGAFGPDNCFGMAWTLLHLVETAPAAHPPVRPAGDANPWHARLWLRYQNSLATD
ncbi:hypothetical protein [Actinoplanes sp. NPDC026619]|uniref:hypothetical protein n=1 Tax=Actinoplanes sp. NPDC026619 TaxID=3155798 RepID=UPI0033FE2ECB